ncbi:MAG: hypothetical protein D3916_03350 [Candidatus Electrothrix sp. MAN1_4]|nr:hypothetical protein [Candidatus Electrothrix sp. MAN1_4]
MQLTINIAEILPKERTARLIAGIRELFSKEGVSCEIEKKISTQRDPWDDLDIEDISVDTGVDDFAENHDHYLYGTAKRS